MVMVNLATARVDFNAPFDGRKASGCCPREQGCHAAEFFTTVMSRRSAVAPNLANPPLPRLSPPVPLR